MKNQSAPQYLAADRHSTSKQSSSLRKLTTSVAGAVAVSTAFPLFSVGKSHGSHPKVSPLIGDVKLSMPARDLSSEQLGFIRDLGVEYAQLQASPGAPAYAADGHVVPRESDHSSPNGPWNVPQIRLIKERVESFGLKLRHLMMHDFRNAILGRPGRDQDIENVQKSIRVAAEVGIPIVEYNWFALRAQPGYYRVPGRPGMEYLAFDYDRIKDLPPFPDIGEHSAEELWERYEYFLKAVIPVAEEVGVRMAVHPNDPPPPVYRGCEQILGSVEGLKRLINIVSSPSNGITWHTGVMNEVGGDPIKLIPYFMKNDQINHIHFRNVRVEVPRLKYTEVLIDEGDVDMARALRTLREYGYSRLLFPDHVPHMDSDVERGKVGWSYAAGYIKGLMNS
jgi:D-mannonate dehydratase